MRFPVVIHKEPSSDYGVTVVDLPGCFSGASSLEGSLLRTREAIECHIEGLLEDGDVIPEMGSFEAHQVNPDYASGRWYWVDMALTGLDSQIKT